MAAACTRRELLRHAPACVALAVVAVSARPGAALAQQKVAKAMVQYQDSPKDGHQCSTCANFVAPGSCKVVQGAVSPKGWCSIWTPRGRG
jgi:hypothetical protein